ncbi:DUF362 domain-containing protein [Chloroflexota bacterium]
MAKSVVSIVKGVDPEKMVEEALSILGGVNSLIRPNSTVVLKPNAGHPYLSETSSSTNPALIAAVIKVLRKAQPKEIILAEAAASGCDTLESFEVSGVGKAAEDAGVDKIIDIKREKDLINVPIRDARSALTRVLLPRFLIEAEHLVNLPIFKAHVSMVFTCALKNIKGTVQDKVHRQMHQTDLAAAMMDLWSICKADLQIVDMIRPQEAFGPSGGLPVDFGCIVAGKDPVAVDATVCRMVGLDVDKVTYFKPARERGLGNFRERNIEVRGRKIEEVFKQLWLPYLGGFEQWPEYRIHAQNACSSCQSLAAYTMESLKALGEYERNAEISIVLGPIRVLPKEVQEVLPRNLILMGDCTKKYRNQGIFVPGCPPGEPLTYWSIIDRVDSEKLDRTFRSRVKRAEEVKILAEHSKKQKPSGRDKDIS